MQHICEEHIKIPIPYPIKEPYQPEYPTHHHASNFLASYRIGSSPPPPYAHQPSVLGGSLASQLFQRHIRSADTEKDTLAFQGIIKRVILEAIQRKEARETNTKARAANPIDFPFHASHHSPYLGHPIAAAPELAHHSHNLVPKLTHSIYQKHSHSHPSIVTTHELPSEPGCRSLATKTCYKIPIIVPKKVPSETCKDVPDVECVTVLKDVPELECTPEPYEECNDLAKDVPYLETEEECEEISFDDCVEVQFFGLYFCIESMVGGDPKV